MKEHQQQVDIVRKQFESQLDIYTGEGGGAHRSHAIPFLTDWVREHLTLIPQDRPYRICEFGGASGILLKLLDPIFQGKAELYNCELLEKYREHQVLPKIHFFNRSVIDSGFENDFFDITIIRNVIHHLIHVDPGKTPANQTFGVGEVFRVTRPGGLVLLEEHTNQSERACRILYFLSRTVSRLNISVKSFEITPHTIIAFLTVKQLNAMVESHLSPDSRLLKTEYRRRRMGLHWRLTFLRNNCGLSFLAFSK